MNKITIRNIGIAVTFCLLLICGLLSTNCNYVYAESTTIPFENFTDTDDYIYNGTKYTIQNYAETIHDNGAINKILNENYAPDGKYASTIKYDQDPATNIMRLVAKGDDPITQIVPKYLFQSVNNGIVHIGAEYGFFIKTSTIADGMLLSNVYVFDFLNQVNEPMLKDSIRFGFISLFQREFVYIPNNINRIPTKTIQPGNILNHISAEFNDYISAHIEQTDIVIPLPYYVSPTLYILANSDRYLLTDITNTVAIYNEQHLNEGDDGYNVFADKGKFVTRQTSQYSAKFYSSNDNRVADALNVVFKAAFKKGFDKLKDLSGTDTMFDILTTFFNAANVTSEDITFENGTFAFDPEYVTAQGIIGENGSLSKTAVSKLYSEDNKILFYSESDKLISNYELGFTPVANEDGSAYKTPWETRIKRGYTFQLKSTTDSADVISVGDVHDFKQKNNSDREYLPLQKMQTIRLFPNGENLFSFTPQYNGNYILRTKSADSDINLEQIYASGGEAVTSHLTGYDIALSLKMTAGVTYYFKTNYIDETKYGNYILEYEFAPKTIMLGNNDVILEHTETYLQFVGKTNLYHFQIDNLTDVLHLLNSNFEVVQTSAAGELLAILNANETYYLRIDRSGSETKTVNLTVKDEMYVFFENIEGITSEIPEKITISSTGSVSLPTPEKRGYTFEGWWTNLDAYGENVTNDNIFDYLRPELHLSAKWTPIHYTIFYEENGGDTIPDGDYIIEHVVTLNQNITKAGFVFCGWYDNPALGGVEIKTFPAGNIGNKTFYAKWVKEKFTISFDVNSNYTDGLSATIEESKQVVDFNQNYVLPVPNLDGFIFQGWYFDTVKFADNNGNSLNAYTIEGNITLTAKWTREKYYIKINANGTFRWLTKDGNDFTFSADKTFVEYEIGLCPNCFVESQIQKGGTLGRQIKDYLYREGHLYLNLIKDPNDSSSLACWKNSELGTEFQNNDTIEIFADYRIESQFKIYISEKEDAGYSYIIYADYDESINYPIPSKAGYTFDYFIVSPDEEKNDVYKNTQFNPGTKFNYKNMPDLSIGVEHDGDAIYLSPVFRANEYNISFTIDGEVWNRKTVTFGESYNSSNGNAFPIPTKTGYKFIGWFSENGIKITDANGNVNCWDIASNCLLKPNWEPNQYKVTFNKQGGSGGTDYVIATYNSEMPYAEKPTLLGHTFMGYFLEIDGQEIQYYTSNMESAHLWDIARDETLKAKWEANQYKITIDYNDGSGRTKDIDVIFGKEIELLPYAPERLGFSFDGAYASPNGVGKKYFYSNDIVYDNDRNDYFENFVSFIEVWDEPASRTIYANWVPYSMDIYPEFYCHGDWSYQKEYRITTNEVLKLTPLDKAGYTFKSWLILEYDPDNNWNLGQNTTISYNNKISYTMQVFLDYGKLASRYQFVAEYTKNPVEEDTCVAEGTLITLSDGTQKAVEDLNGSEQLLVWNLFTGTFDTAPILFIDHDPAREYEVINLAFSDETTVKVISEHGFWDFDLNEYVFLRRDAAKYIGHWFNKQTTDAEGNLAWTKVQLVNVTIQKEITTAWSPVTYGHLCYYVNGMLSMPGATEGLINIFDVDPNTLKIDEAKYNADIAEYGLYTYEEFAETYPVPEVIFEAFGGQYLKVSIGKGLIDRETLGRLIERYAKFFA